jgi:hypothetical protein
MFENLKVSRVTLHHVFRRAPGGARIDPTVGDTVIRPTGDVKKVLQQRLVAVLASNTKSMTVDITKSGVGSAFQICRSAVDGDDEIFVEMSAVLANKLADAQLTPTPTEGFLFVMCGTSGPLANRFIALMKAEPQDGFSIQDGEGISFSLLDNLVLTPASKLYKVGLFIEQDFALSNESNAAGWAAHLYDDNMSQANREKASIYFYEAFLGCALPKDNAYRTKQFYDLTENFINALAEPPETKSDLKTALYTYLKVDASVNVSVDGFADNFFAQDAARMTQYKNHMATSDFPTFAFTKDIQDLAVLLRRRTLKFPSGTRITGLASSIDGLTIQTETVSDSSGMVHDQTVVTIPEKMSTV